MEGITLSDMIQTFGAAGLFIAYLINRERLERLDRKEKEEKDRDVIREDVASRQALVATLGALTEAVRNAGERH